MDIQTKRKKWPVLFSELSPKDSINEWIKFFFVFWMAYLIYYTNNPISQALFVSSKEFLDNPSLAIKIKVVAGGVIYFAIILAGVIWACGFKSFRQFFPKFRFINILFTVLYTVLASVFFFIGLIVSADVPSKFEADISNSMQYAAFFDPEAFQVMAIRGFFMTMANVLVSVMVFLMIYQLLSHFSHKYVRCNLFASYIISGMIYGILITRPDNPGILQNMVFYAIAMLPAFWAYHRTRSVMITTTALWISSQITTALILLISLP